MTDRSATALELYNQFLAEEAAGRSDEALAALVKSMELGEPMAHHVLAYYELKKPEPRTAWALRHYRSAAEKGFAPSAWNLARHYEGLGRSALYEKWMGLAARLGDPDAKAELRGKRQAAGR